MVFAALLGSSECCFSLFDDRLPGVRIILSVWNDEWCDIHVPCRLVCLLQVTLLQNWFIWCTSVVPYMVIAGRYLRGDEEFGIVTQTVMSFRMIVSGSDARY